MGRSRYKMLIPGKQPYFLTSTVFNWIPILHTGDIRALITPWDKKDCCLLKLFVSNC